MQFHEGVRSHMFGNGIKVLSFWPPLQPFVSQKKVDELWGQILPKPRARSTVAFFRSQIRFLKMWKPALIRTKNISALDPGIDTFKVVCLFLWFFVGIFVSENLKRKPTNPQTSEAFRINFSVRNFLHVKSKRILKVCPCEDRQEKPSPALLQAQ